MGDFERISDHALNLAETAMEMQAKEETFSEKAKGELVTYGEAVKEIMDLSVEAYKSGSMALAERVEPLEEVIDDLNVKIKNHHVKRLRKGKCTIELGLSLSDILTNYERVADHCSNIAVCLIQVEEDGFETHEYLNEVKQNEISTVVANMPMYDGLSVVVADGKSGEIYGCSYEPVVGLTLDEIGISVTDDVLPDGEDSFTGIRKINGFRNRCVFRRSGEYVIGVIYRMDVNSRSNMAIMVIMALYLCFAAGLVVSMVMKVIHANRERNEQLSILTSMSGMYYSMHMLDLQHDTFALYTAGDLILRVGERAAGAKELMRKIVHKVVVDEHQASAQKFIDLDSLGDRLIKKKIVSGEFMVKDLGWFRLSFISIDVDEDGRPLKVIFTTRNIDEDKKREQKLIRRSYTDELTKCYNRSAYIDDVRELPGDSVYVYVSMDVNGLKPVNDTLGHAAGDELLQGAAECMEQCFGNYGKVYRMGGDEFAAIIFVNTRRLKRVQQEFDDVVRGWSGQLVKSVSISCGYVSSDEKDWESFDEMVKAADERMYENKAAYYRQEGVDRRYH